MIIGEPFFYIGLAVVIVAVITVLCYPEEWLGK